MVLLRLGATLRRLEPLRRRRCGWRRRGLRKGCGDWRRGGRGCRIIGVLLTRGNPTIVYPEQVLTFRVEPIAISTSARHKRSALSVRKTINNLLTSQDYRAARRWGLPIMDLGIMPLLGYGYGWPYYGYPYYYGPRVGIGFAYRGGFARRASPLGAV